jgi:hypothetical protein
MAVAPSALSRSGRPLLVKAAALLFLSPAVSLAQARQSFDFTACHAGAVKVLFADKEVALRSAEGWGIVVSNQPNKLFDNATFHVVTTIRTVGKDSSEAGYYKLMDLDGDFILAEVSRSGGEQVSRFFYGTGKWKGITGSSRSERIVFRVMPPDWAAACSRTVGTFELPKQ